MVGDSSGMVTATKKRRVFGREQDVLEFARSYLSEAFPNPERKACPPNNALRDLASRPTDTDGSISNHLTCCSPCFNAYMAHLAHARVELIESQKIRRAAWVTRSLATAGVLAVLMIALYVFFNRRHIEHTVAPRTPEPIGKPAKRAQVPASAMYVPVLIDLSNASPVRGLDRGESGPSPQVIPSSPLMNLNLLLPFGSEERRYSVKLSASQGVVWSGLAQAHLEKGQMLLHMHADFSQVPAGNYDLVVVSTGFRISVPVLVKSASSGRIQ
jgi:hypothetical protein